MDKTKIKYFYFDMDGTLLDDNRQLSFRNVGALRKLMTSGYKVGIISGRPDYIMKEEAALIGPNLPIVAINGAKIINQNKVLRFQKMDPVPLAKVMRFLVAHEFTFLAYSEKELYYHLPPGRQSQWLSWHFAAQKQKTAAHQWALNPFKAGLTDFAKVLVITSESPPENEHKLKAFITQFPSLYGVASSPSVWDLMPRGNSKGRGLQFLSAKKLIDLKQTVVFGDAENDLPMFKAAAFSVAMQNASAIAKKGATIVSKFTNNNSGVAKFLEEMILNGTDNN